MEYFTAFVADQISIEWISRSVSQPAMQNEFKSKDREKEKDIRMSNIVAAKGMLICFCWESMSGTGGGRSKLTS